MDAARALRLFPLALLLLAAPVAAQTEAASPVDQAMSLIERHEVAMNIPCSVPLPAGPHAPDWEQEAAWRRIRAFTDCLDGVMEREQDRLSRLTYDIDSLRAEAPNAEWAGVDQALDSKWDELDTLAGKLRIRSGWADAAITVVNAFAPPENPMFPSFPAGTSPYSNGYRRDSSVSAPGIR